MLPCTSKNIAPKQMIFHLLLYASFCLTQTQYLNLTQYLLTYWIVFPKIYLHFYLLIFTFILRILKLIQCIYAFSIKTNKVLIRLDVLFIRFSSSKCSYVFFSMKFLPVHMELLLRAKIIPDVNNYLLFVHIGKSCTVLCMFGAAFSA